MQALILAEHEAATAQSELRGKQAEVDELQKSLLALEYSQSTNALMRASAGGVQDDAGSELEELRSQVGRLERKLKEAASAFTSKDSKIATLTARLNTLAASSTEMHPNDLGYWVERKRRLDFSGVDYVVHYQLPRSAEVYVHRSGRTARAAATGKSIAMVEPANQKDFRRLSHELQIGEGLPDFPLQASQLPHPAQGAHTAAQSSPQPCVLLKHRWKVPVSDSFCVVRGSTASTMPSKCSALWK